MITFKIVRKIGKMLRGGAGRKEIFLGTLCGVLIGFNPVAGVTLALAILITLLLNANIGFALLGAAIGKLLSIVLSIASFHTGYFIIHKIGLEGLFTKLANAPVTALMDLDVYAMIGSLPFSILFGIAFGLFIGATITKIREQMVKAAEHDKVGKAVGNTFSRFLMWLAFGKQKVSTADVLAKASPLFRKSGLILVGCVLVIGLLMEFLLLDRVVKSGLQSAIAAETGAEVNVAKAHLSLAGGTLELEGVQITDPDKPTHNMIQLKTLAADISIGDLLRRSYTIDLLSGSTLQRDTLRESPGSVFEKKKKAKEDEEKSAGDDADGKSIDEYFAQAGKWKEYAQKVYDYLKKNKAEAEPGAEAEVPGKTQPAVSIKEAAMADAEKVGYLKAAADLTADRPAWIIRKIEITDVQLGDGLPAQNFQALEVSSHPALNGLPTSMTMTPESGGEPTAKVVLRFDDPAALNEIKANLNGLPVGGAFEASDSFPLNVKDGQADIRVDGTFSTEILAVPFAIVVHDLKADVEEGKSVLGMDSATATEVLSSMEQVELDGSLGGSLLSPRVKIDYDKLTANMKTALVSAGKKKLSKRANKEMDKAKEELGQQAGDQLNKLLGGDDADGEENDSGTTEDKAKGMLKKFF